MTLTGALESANAGLSTASGQIAVISRNIANQSNSSASRKIANIATVNGLATVTSVTRATDDALMRNLLSANGDTAKQSSISTSLTQLEQTLGTSTSDTTSPTALIGQLSTALQTYAVDPSNTASADAAVVAAQNLAKGLNTASQTVQTVRAQADSDIASSVGTINSLLSQFQQVNDSIVNSPTGADITDLQDQRDSILQNLSSEVGITTVTRANNDMAIYTDSGVTLFDKSARSVTFTQTTNYGAATVGDSVYADGVPITDQSSSMAIKTGRLAGLVSVRDDLAVTYQKQLDEIARGLITDFKETDQEGAGQPDQAGLFTNGTDLTIPADATVSTGLAATITVSSNVNPDGGTPTLLRDGGISSNGGSPYVYNPDTSQQGYSDRLNELIKNLSTSLTFDASAQTNTQANVSDYASASASWLGVKISQASSAATYSTTVQKTATTALSNSTGVNLDTELSKMLEVEQSYQASAKLLTTINDLYTSLFDAIQ